MLDYEWGSPPTIVLSGEDQTQESDPTHHHPSLILSPPPLAAPGSLTNHHAVGYGQTHNQANHYFHHQYSFYDPRASYASESSYSQTHQSSFSPFAAAAALFSLDQTSVGSLAGPYFVVPKAEDVSRPALDFTPSRIGLNLGGRTYFSAADDDFVSRLYRRSRPGESGAGNSLSSPRCQAEGCNADLSHAKHYHRRHKVCEFHSKASTVIAGGLAQRFCQQCSRFHLLSEFDNGKRSCRKRLADHNRRRRKSHQSSAGAASDALKPPPEIIIPRSPNESSGAQSSSSLTVPLSPPTISLECFRQCQYQTTASSSSASSSSNSIFFSSG